MLEALRRDRSEILGARDPDTLGTRNDLACALVEAGRASEAVTMLRALLAEQTKILSADHPEILVTRDNLDSALEAAGA
jgi:thioredoxin-like negative regulator of GroEL